MATGRMSLWGWGGALGFLVLVSASPVPLGAVETVTVAVAANFAAPMRDLAARFEAETGHRATIVSGSTGKQYAQIVNGAPFDLFFAADEERPRRLENEQLAVVGTRRTYAVGRLVLWSPRPGVVDSEGAVLRSGSFRHLATANPRLAPYGRAALEVLESLALAERLSDRIVLGENVAQAFQLAASGNAELGFVALSQIRGAPGGVDGSYWLVPQALYAPIEQQAILIRDTEAAWALLEYLATDGARALIRSYGYETR